MTQHVPPYKTLAFFMEGGWFINGIPEPMPQALAIAWVEEWKRKYPDRPGHIAIVGYETWREELAKLERPEE